MRASVVVASVLIFAAMVAPAIAEPGPSGTCKTPSADPEERVADCSTLLEGATLGERERAALLASRAEAYEASADFSSAMQDFDEAVGRDPSSARALNGACRARAATNTELHVAQSLCDRSAARQGAGDSLAGLRVDGRELLMLRQEELVRALHEYDRLLAKGPRKASTLFMRAFVKRQLGDHVGADEDFTAAMMSDAGIAQVFNGYGIRDPRTANPAWSQKLDVARRLSVMSAGFTFSSQLLPEMAPESDAYDPEICAQSGQLDRALIECRRIMGDRDISGIPLAAVAGRCAEIEFLMGRHADALHDLEIAARHDPWNRGYEANLKVIRALLAK